METFQFFFDQKATTWFRTSFEIEAENYEEAKKRAIGLAEKGEVSQYPWESISETTELMSTEENDGQPTEELYSNKDYDLIYSN